MVMPESVWRSEGVSAMGLGYEIEPKLSHG